MAISTAPIDYSRCLITAPCTRKQFWATQPDACGSTIDACGDECGRPGLVLLPSGSFDTSNYVRGLALNILGTDGPVAEDDCGVRPGNRGGHWSQIFAGTNAKIGTRFRYQSFTVSITQAPALIATHLQMDLNRLVSYGVAKSVTVTGTYLGGGRVEEVIEIIGENEQTNRVAVTGARVQNAWAWA